MRRVIALFLALWTGIPWTGIPWTGIPWPGVALAQDAPLPDALVVMEESFALWQGGDLAGYEAYIGAALRRAREEDALPPEWAFLFGTFSDYVRNEQRNSPYALRLAEEGLAYLAPNAAANPDLSALLQISRVYALADLGQYDEAARSARLAEPLFRQSMGDDLADDLLQSVAEWEAGRATVFNNAPTDLARETLAKAEAALDNGDYGLALTLAARATLPDGAGLDVEDVRRINAAAAARSGRALYWLDRKAEAFALMRDAAAMIAPEGWEEPGSDASVLTIDPAGDQQALAQLFFWLARAALDTDALWLVPQALDRAEALDDGSIGLIPIVLVRASWHDALFDPQAAEAALLSAAEMAEAAGQGDQAMLARHHAALRRYAATGAEAEATALIALTRRMVAEGGPASFYDPLNIQTLTAQMLAGSDHAAAALEFARVALSGELAALAQSRDSALGQEGARAQVRGLAETLLWAAHAMDAQGPNADCSRDAAAGLGCVILHLAP